MTPEKRLSLRGMCQRILDAASTAAEKGRVPELGSRELRMITEAGTTLASMEPEDDSEVGNRGSGKGDK